MGLPEAQRWPRCLFRAYARVFCQLIKEAFFCTLPLPPPQEFANFFMVAGAARPDRRRRFCRRVRTFGLIPDSPEGIQVICRWKSPLLFFENHFPGLPFGLTSRRFLPIAVLSFAVIDGGPKDDLFFATKECRSRQERRPAGTQCRFITQTSARGTGRSL